MSNECECGKCNCAPSMGIQITDNMGREIFWEDIGRKDD